MRLDSNLTTTLYKSLTYLQVISTASGNKRHLQ